MNKTFFVIIPSLLHLLRKVRKRISMNKSRVK
jgi:hypothetical protein